MFISLEGTDGAGKSVQIKLLKEYIESKFKKEVISLYDPGSTKISEELRKIVLDVDNKEMGFICEALIYSASRAQLVFEKIKPALDEGKVVICDRFVDSNLVYQGCVRNLGVDKIRELNNFATDGLMPSLTFFLNLDPKVSLNRRKNERELDRIELLGYDFQEKVRQAYLDNAKEEPERIKIIDASKEIDEVHKQIVEIIDDFFIMGGK